MAPPLRAGLKLELVDQNALVQGVQQLQGMIDALKQTLQDFGFGGLTSGLDQLREAIAPVDALNAGLRGTELQANAAAEAISRIATAVNDNVIRVNSQGISTLNRSLGSLVVVPGGGGGGGGDASFGNGGGVGGGEIPLLGGPAGAGGIPLNYRPYYFGDVHAAGRDFLGASREFSGAASEGINKGLGAAVEGFAVYEPVKAYAERDNLLRSIGIMEHLSGAPLETEIKRLNTLVNSDATKHAISSDSVAEAYKDLLGQGVPANKIDEFISAHSAAAKAYGIPPDILGPVTGALVGNMKVAANENDVGGALAAIATASQGGRFKMVDFSHELPGLTGVAASLGMTGRSSLNELAAGLEISTKTATDPTQAGVNFHDLLAYITSNREDNLSRKKLGLDMPSLLLKAEAAGTNPLDAYLHEIQKITAHKSPVMQAQVISGIVTNQQARNALLALVQHKDEFEQLRKTLAGINAEKLKIDEGSASAGPLTGLNLLEENTHQLNLTLGESFAPVLGVVGAGLGYVNQGLAWMNGTLPSLTHLLLGSVAAALALGAALTVVGIVGPLIATGWGVLAAGATFLGTVFSAIAAVIASVATAISLPVLAVVAAVAAISGAAYELYQHWGGVAAFFGGVWDSTKTHFTAFSNWVGGWARTIGSVILSAIQSGWAALVAGFEALIHRLEHPLSDSWLGRHLGLGDLAPIGAVGAAAAGASASPVTTAAAGDSRRDKLDVTVKAEPGSAVTAATSTNPDHSVNTSNPGRVLGRP